MSDRYNRGWKLFRRINWSGWKALPTHSIKPRGIRTLLMEFVFGDIYSRPALDVKQRHSPRFRACGARHMPNHS